KRLGAARTKAAVHGAAGVTDVWECAVKKKRKTTWSEQDVQKWFWKLDRVNAIEPFVCEREQPPVQERVGLMDVLVPRKRVMRRDRARKIFEALALDVTETTGDSADSEQILCPLCMAPHLASDQTLRSPGLTEEHIIPQTLGG